MLTDLLIFFYFHTLWTIGSKVIVEKSTTRYLRRYTILWIMNATRTNSNRQKAC